MGKTLDEVMAGLPAQRRRKIEQRGAQLVAEEMTLQELRKAMGRTQSQVARATGKPQATISRMEAQSDMLLSNLDQVVGALGGRVRILAELPGRAPVLLTGLGNTTPAATSTAGRRSRVSKAVGTRLAPMKRPAPRHLKAAAEGEADAQPARSRRAPSPSKTVQQA